MSQEEGLLLVSMIGKDERMFRYSLRYLEGKLEWKNDSHPVVLNLHSAVETDYVNDLVEDGGGKRSSDCSWSLKISVEGTFCCVCKAFTNLHE